MLTVWAVLERGIMFPNIAHRLPSQHNSRFYIRLRIQKQFSVDDGPLIFGSCCLICALALIFGVMDIMYMLKALADGHKDFDIPSDLPESSILLPKNGGYHRSIYVANDRLRQVRFLSFVQQTNGPNASLDHILVDRCGFSCCSLCLWCLRSRTCLPPLLKFATC